MKILKKLILIIGLLIGIQVIGIFSNEVMASSGKINIEIPKQGETKKGTVSVNGWALSDDKNSYVQILLDGTIIGNANRYSREDVLKAIPGYGGRASNPNPGFDFSYDISNLTEGKHILSARIVSSYNTILTIQDIEINVKRYNARLNLEIPSPNETIRDTLKINGWALADDKNAYIQIF